MTHRSRNRLAEHGPHGWKETAKTSVLRRGMALMECPCGWVGWVDAEAARLDVEGIVLMEPASGPPR